jgi:hypothetical protein
MDLASALISAPEVLDQCKPMSFPCGRVCGGGCYWLSSQRPFRSGVSTVIAWPEIALSATWNKGSARLVVAIAAGTYVIRIVGPQCVCSIPLARPAIAVPIGSESRRIETVGSIVRREAWNTERFGRAIPMFIITYPPGFRRWAVRSCFPSPLSLRCIHNADPETGIRKRAAVPAMNAMNV